MSTSIVYDGSAVYAGGYSGSIGVTQSLSDFILVKLNADTAVKEWARYYGLT